MFRFWLPLLVTIGLGLGVPHSLMGMPPPAPRITFDHLTTKDGLSHNSVYAILQDRQGFMWFGTYVGLSKYDGYEFTIYRHDPENPATLSHNAIVALCEDAAGMIWVGTQGGGLNRFDPVTERFQRYQHDPDDPHSLGGNKVAAILEERPGLLWVGTKDGGLHRFDPATGRFERYQHDPEDSSSLSSNKVLALLLDQRGDLWIGTDAGLNRLERDTGTFQHYQHDPDNPHSVGHNKVNALLEDHLGELWVSTQGGGVHRFDRQTGRFVRYQHDPQNPRSLSDNGSWKVGEDHEGRVWVGTLDAGLNLYNRETDDFTRYRYDPTRADGPNDDKIRAMYTDQHEVFWIGTKSGGVNALDHVTKRFQYYRHDPNDPTSLSNSGVSEIYQDRAGAIWVGTLHGLNRFDPDTGQFVRYQHDPRDPYSISQHRDVVSLYEDRAGLLWIGTLGGGLNAFDPEPGRFTRYLPDPDDPSSLAHESVNDVYEDRSGALWVGTYGGGLDRLDRQTGEFRHYTHDPEDPHSLSYNTVNFIYEDRMGMLWIGTRGGGLNRFDGERQQFLRYRHDPNDPTSLSSDDVKVVHEDQTGVLWFGTEKGLNQFDRPSGTFTQYRAKDGLPDDAINGIVADQQGYFWLSTRNGLGRFDPRTGACKNYSVADGLPSNEFSRSAYYAVSNGELWFGTYDGLLRFDPQQIVDNPFVPPVVLTRFQLANQPVEIGGDSGLPRPISLLDSLTLSYRERVISFEFAALSYKNPARNRYKYRLEGFEESWNEVDSTRRYVTYTNLDPGAYTFRVLGSNDDGRWNEAGASLELRITPPYWETWWFRLLAAILIVGGVLAVFYARIRNIEIQRRRLEAQVAERTKALAESNLELEHATQHAKTERRKAEQANQAKSTFLANMSHELRTPLNAIIGFAELTARDAGLPPEGREHLRVIQRNGAYLLTLINQVLDLSKIEAGRMTLQERNFDLYQVYNELKDMFAIKAEAKGLYLLFEREANVPRYIRTDEVKLRQVLINLLGNAVKFTTDGGVRVQLAVAPEAPAEQDDTARLTFEITDTGPGIAPEEQRELFEAFTQTTAGLDIQEGTGLGLAITRKFVQLMGGDIEVTSTLGQGATFRFDIHVGLVDAAAVEQAVAARRVIALEPGQPRYRLLVVDDKPDNRRLLVKLLQPFGFELREAANGQEAIEVWQDWHPHLIWMDVRMPGMDGYAATQQIRQHATDTTAPRIIALSASSLDRDFADYRAGGFDDFLRKPFREHQIFTLLHQHLGVRFVYEEAEPTPAEAKAPASGEVLTPEAVAALPDELRTELQQVVQTLDWRRAQDVVTRIRPHNAALADALDEVVKGFRFDTLQALLRTE